MSRLDVVIFGATGFTGKYAVEEMVRLAKKYPGVTWGVAGRSMPKLHNLMREVAEKTSEELSHVRMIVADVRDPPSLEAMCGSARVVASCCGPYRALGEPVLRAALRTSTHYVDVSGEPQFMETMQLLYDEEARAAGVCLVSGCGFDSIPNDMGVVYMQQHFGGTLNSVESYLETEVRLELQQEARRTGVIHYGTWESLVYSLAYDYQLKPLRQKLYPQKMPSFKPILKKRGAVHRRDGGWYVPFPGADAAVVHRTQRRRLAAGLRPAQFKAYVRAPSAWAVAALALASIVIYLLSKAALTRRLLLAHPRLFSLGLVTREGPSEAVMKGTTFSVTLHGEGWREGADVDSTAPDKKVVVKVSGTNPGYGATVTALLLSALTVLRTPHTGGVLTTGAAFKDTDLIEKLNDNNITFKVIEDSTK